MASDDEVDVEPAVTHAMDAAFDWDAAYADDKAFRSVYARLKAKAESPDPTNLSDPAADPNFHLHGDGSMRFRGSSGDRVCLPATSVKDALYVAHDALGHFGFEKTYDRVAATYYRPGLSSLVKQYVQFCPKCLKNKTSRSKKQGELMSIDAPSAVEPSAFRSINMDLIVNLPPSGGYDAILVVVDRCTKTAIFVPTVSSYSADTIAELLFDNVVRRGFIPEKIITDRDPKITKSFWKTLARRLNLKHSLTAAWHAQTDGAAERLNQTLETAIRAYVSPQLDDWHASLSMLELAYNTAKNASTGMSPFDLLYVQPQNVVDRLMGISDRDSTDNLQAQDFVENARNRLKDAREAVTKSLRLQKLYYDRRHGPIRPIQVGDFVSIRLADHPVSLVTSAKSDMSPEKPARSLENVRTK
jgi:transposase InsO family protein